MYHDFNFIADNIFLKTNNLLTEKKQIKFPKSKKKRILKKWANNPNNFLEVPSKEILVSNLDGKVFLICHPYMKAEILGSIEKMNISINPIPIFNGVPPFITKHKRKEDKKNGILTESSCQIIFDDIRFYGSTS